MKTTPVSVANIEIERERYKMSQEYIAEILGVTVRVYEGWLSGETDIPASAIAKLARLWGVSSDYLLGLTSRR